MIDIQIDFEQAGQFIAYVMDAIKFNGVGIGDIMLGFVALMIAVYFIGELIQSIRSRRRS